MKYILAAELPNRDEVIHRIYPSLFDLKYDFENLPHVLHMINVYEISDDNFWRCVYQKTWDTVEINLINL